MELNVDLSELSLVAAKIQGLESYLFELRRLQKNCDEGLLLAKEFVLDNNGSFEDLNNDKTKLVLNGVTAICYQPYPDIDQFYYEI